MGTSNAYGGPNGGTPLVPSWLEPDGSPDGGNSQPDNNPPTTPSPSLNPPERPPIPPAGDPDRFRTARTNYTRFVKSGGRDRASLGRAVSSYVSQSTGGARRAAQRMRTSQAAAVKLTNFLYTAAGQGVHQALKELNLEALAGFPIEDVFLGIADFICPDGGPVDDGIARDAFFEAIADLAENGINSFDGMTTAQIQTVFELYATYSIEDRLCNDIGNKTIILPADAHEAANVQAQLHDFIQRGVADVLSQALISLHALSQENIQHFVGHVYEQAFSILQALGEKEGESV